MLDRKEYRSRLKVWVREYKSLCGCAVCGISDPYRLEFHHLDPAQKLYKIADMVSKGMRFNTILKEIAKCQVLCTEHHDQADKILLDKFGGKMPRNPNKHKEKRGGKKYKRKKVK